MDKKLLEHIYKLKKELKSQGKSIPDFLMSSIKNQNVNLNELNDDQYNTLFPNNTNTNLETNNYTNKHINKENTVNKFNHTDLSLNNYFDSKLNEFKGGGTHEENPIGGIPQGIGSNGKMNTVEEGETSYEFTDDKFIFSNRINTDGKIKDYKKNSNSFPDGGKLDPKEYLIDYVNSSKYKKRLEKAGYKNIQDEVNNRINNLKKTKYINQKEKPGIFKQLYNKFTNTPYTMYGSVYKDDINSIIIDETQPKRMGISKNSMIAHELGHALMDSNNINRFRLNDYETNELKSRLNSNLKDPHDLKAHENKADLDAFRYELMKQGIYDAGKENFTKKHLNKAKSSFIKNRLNKNYSEDNLIWLMNNIALNINKNKYKNIT